MVEVGAYATRNQAELAQAALVAAGVASRLVAHDGGGGYADHLACAARLVVDEADFELAMEILGTDGRDGTDTNTGPA